MYSVSGHDHYEAPALAFFFSYSYVTFAVNLKGH